MEAEHDPVQQILRNAFEVASASWNTASETFDDIVCEIPSGLPPPDGIQRIKNASVALAAARRNMQIAAARLREYEIRRIVPEDLKKSGLKVKSD